MGHIGLYTSWACIYIDDNIDGLEIERFNYIYGSWPEGESVFESVTIYEIPSNKKSDKPVKSEPELRKKQANPSPWSHWTLFFRWHIAHSVHKNGAYGYEDCCSKQSKLGSSLDWLSFEKRKIVLMVMNMMIFSHVLNFCFCIKLYGIVQVPDYLHIYIYIYIEAETGWDDLGLGGLAEWVVERWEGCKVMSVLTLIVVVFWNDVTLLYEKGFFFFH